MEQTPTMPPGDQPRFELIEEAVPKESLPASSPPAAPQPADFTRTSSQSPDPNMAGKRKGTAKKVGRPTKKGKKSFLKSQQPGDPNAPSDDEESDHGPYCICRGPDDHRWMICCENCEDWFHGQCINIDKDIGESLIEKFICPNCTSGNLVTLWKKTCALSGCRRASRLAQEEQSVFCSNEHAQTWWERMVAKLPKSRAKAAMNGQLSQEEFMALLNSDLSGLDAEGKWRLAKTPFAADESENPGIDDDSNDKLLPFLSDEEKTILDGAANARFHLAEETLLCHKMLTLIELAQDRRRAAITGGHFGEDICGYDQRLDTICARDAFAAFFKSAEGEAIFKASQLGDPQGEDDAVRGMCERKRCKVHSGWQKMLVLGIKHQIREMASEAAEVGEDERVVREAAGERWRRKKAENNWIEVLDG